MTMLEIGAFSSLMMYLEEIKPEQITRIGGRIGKNENEKVVGNIADQNHITRLWCAGVVLRAKSQETAARAETAPDDNAERALKGESEQLERLAKLAMTVFWYEVNDLIGWGRDDLGVRDGWDVVETKPKRGLEGLKEFLGGL